MILNVTYLSLIVVAANVVLFHRGQVV